MGIEKREDGVAIIDEYSLVDFVKSIQTCVQEGFEISLENEHYPQGMSGWYRVGMVKKAVAEQPVEAVEVDKPKTTAARTRK